MGMGWLECDQSGNGVAGVRPEWEWGGWSGTGVAGVGWEWPKPPDMIDTQVACNSVVQDVPAWFHPEFILVTKQMLASMYKTMREI